MKRRRNILSTKSVNYSCVFLGGSFQIGVCMRREKLRKRKERGKSKEKRCHYIILFFYFFLCESAREFGKEAKEKK
jgi:hypothetical protein